MQDLLNKTIEFLKQSIKNENYKSFISYKKKNLKERDYHDNNAKCYKNALNFINDMIKLKNMNIEETK